MDDTAAPAKQSRTTRAIRNFWANLISQALIFICGILLPKVLISNYGSDTNGLLNSINQVFVYAALIETGIGTAAINLLYRFVADKDQKSINGAMYRIRRFYLKASILYVAVVIGLSFLYPLAVKTNVDYWTIVFVMLLQGAWTAIPYFTFSPLHMLMQAEGKHYVLIFFDAGTRIAMTLLKILLYSLGANIIVVQAVGLGVAILKAVAYYIYRRKKYPWVSFAKQDDAPELRSTPAFTLAAFARAVMESTDTILLSVLVSTQLASVYSVYALIFLTLKGAVNSLLFGQFAIGQDYQTQKKTYVLLHDSLESFTTTMVTALMTTACCLTIPFLSLYTKGFTDVDYIDPLLPILFSLIGILGPARSVCTSLISASKSTKRMAIQHIVEVTINIGVSIPLILFWGVRGALLATIIAMTVVGADIYFFANRKLIGRMPWKALKTLFLSLALFAAFAVPSYFIDYRPSGYLAWFVLALAVFVVALTCFAILFITTSPREFAHLYELFRRHMTKSVSEKDDLDFQRKTYKKRRRFALPWGKPATMNTKLAYALLVLCGLGFVGFSSLTGTTSYLAVTHEKILVLDEYAKAYAEGKEQWICVEERLDKNSAPFRDVVQWQSAFTVRPNYLQSFFTIGPEKESFVVQKGDLLGRPIEMAGVANYTDNDFMESLSIPLYRNRGYTILGHGGAEYGCYISEYQAKTIIASNPEFSTLDDFFTKTYFLYLADPAGNVHSFSVENIYLDRRPDGVTQEDYDDFLRRRRDYPAFFHQEHPNAIISYSAALSSDFGVLFNLDVNPSYSSVRDALKKSIGLDYAAHGHSVSVSIHSTGGTTYEMDGVLNLDETARGDNVFAGLKVYYVLPAVFFGFAFMLFATIISRNLKGRLIVVWIKCFALSMWPAALMNYARWIWILAAGKTALLPLLAFSVVANGLVVLLGAGSFLLSVILANRRKEVPAA